jgi:hypothetical protein
MDMPGLLDRLKIEAPGQLEYFEQYAELAEAEDDISIDILAEFFMDADSVALRELTEAYFEEILSGAPESETEFYLLLMNIGRILSELASGAGGTDEAHGAYEADYIDEESARRAYVEEFYRFRSWYTTEQNVPRGEERVSVLEALAIIRAAKLIGGADGDAVAGEFDFTESLNYELDEYIINL